MTYHHVSVCVSALTQEWSAAEHLMWILSLSFIGADLGHESRQAENVCVCVPVCELTLPRGRYSLGQRPVTGTPNQLHGNKKVVWVLDSLELLNFNRFVFQGCLNTIAHVRRTSFRIWKLRTHVLCCLLVNLYLWSGWFTLLTKISSLCNSLLHAHLLWASYSAVIPDLRCQAWMGLCGETSSEWTTSQEDDKLT